MLLYLSLYIYIELLIFNTSLLFYPATEYVSRAENNILFYLVSVVWKCILAVATEVAQIFDLM